MNKLILSFDIKLDIKEENIITKIYTGSKWIKNNIPLLNDKFTHIEFTETFNFNTKSKWRISTSSKKVGQIITISNINFTYL